MRARHELNRETQMSNTFQSRPTLVRLGLVLAPLVATLGIVSLGTSAQAQTPMISQVTIGPGRVIASLDALPQISAQGGATQWTKPYRTLDDPASFAVRQAAAKMSRFTASGSAQAGAPAQMPTAGSSQTINPAEAVFDGTSNAQCGIVSGFTVNAGRSGARSRRHHHRSAAGRQYLP